MAVEFRTNDQIDSYGQYFIIGLSGTTLSDVDKKLLGDIKPAGVLLLARNFDHEREYQDWLSALESLLSEVHQYAERDKMMITLDHEGESTHRAPAPITKFPNAIHYRERGPEVAAAMSTELTSMGINVSWAPCADIHTNPANPIIGSRAFGDNVEDACKYSVPFARELEKNGIVGCAKHYPGHGNTFEDTHLCLPSVSETLETLLDRELRPFSCLIEEDIPMVMTAHILYPRVEPNIPATYSKKFLTSILREQMQFKGAIVSDDIEMEAVHKDFINDPMTIGKAVDAGCDIFIASRFKDTKSLYTMEIAKAFSKCLSSKAFSEEQLHASFQRVEIVLDKLQPSKTTILSDEVFQKHQVLSDEIRAENR